MQYLSRRRFLATAAALPIIRFAGAEETKPAWGEKLEAIRIQHKIPAIGGAIVTSAGLQSVAVTGFRKVGSNVMATVDDLWHLGSNTKAMTSTLAAIAVEAGKIDWDTTLEDVFRGKRGLKRTPLNGATLTHFLSHWSGLPANPAWSEAAQGGRDVRSQRAKAMEMAIELSELPEPGKKHLYSNWGYVIAGHMLEKVTDLPWEEQMRRAVFTPLGITKAGFGGTGTLGKIDQPWPHGMDGKPMPKNGPDVDNLPVLGPAGTVHMSFSDWAKFVAEHLAGRNGRGKLLKAPTYKRLHAAAQAGEPYAYGWLDVERSWGGRVLSHSGSNTMNYSVAWLAPEKDFAVLACTNQGSELCNKVLDDVASMLIAEIT